MLRHGSEKEKLQMRSDGYVAITDLLMHKKFKGTTFDEIE